MGDFNINLLGVEKCNQYANNFLLSLQRFSLFRQLIKPTRFHNNSATLIIYIEIILLKLSFFWGGGGGGGPNCESRPPLARQPALRAEANRS